MNDNNFYLGWAAIAAALIVSVVVSVAVCISVVNIRSKDAVLEMVKAGADPIAAACAVGQLDSMPGVCVGVVVRK